MHVFSKLYSSFPLHIAHMSRLRYNLITDAGVNVLVEGLITHCEDVRELK